jgi:hypothetical protein
MQHPEVLQCIVNNVQEMSFSSLPHCFYRSVCLFEPASLPWRKVRSAYVPIPFLHLRRKEKFHFSKTLQHYLLPHLQHILPSRTASTPPQPKNLSTSMYSGNDKLRSSSRPSPRHPPSPQHMLARIPRLPPPLAPLAPLTKTLHP